MFCLNLPVFINVVLLIQVQTPYRHSQDRSLYRTIPRNTTDLVKMCTKRVLITGFGPFSEVEINPSWGGVNCMTREEIERKYNIHFYQEKIDVVYDSIDESVPKLWAKLQPDLTIHVGVRDNINHFLLETQAAKESYIFPDTNNACPVDFRHTSDGPDTICTDLDVDILCEQFNNGAPAGLKAEKSSDAGKYVCEYTYYTSLACCGCSKTLFVHVPLEGFSFELIAQGLERILEVCLGQLGN